MELQHGHHQFLNSSLVWPNPFAFKMFRRKSVLFTKNVVWIPPNSVSNFHYGKKLFEIMFVKSTFLKLLKFVHYWQQFGQDTQKLCTNNSWSWPPPVKPETHYLVFITHLAHFWIFDGSTKECFSALTTKLALSWSSRYRIRSW